MHPLRSPQLLEIRFHKAASLGKNKPRYLEALTRIYREEIAQAPLGGTLIDSEEHSKHLFVLCTQEALNENIMTKGREIYEFPLLKIGFT